MKGVEKMQPETTKKPTGGLTSPVDRLSALPDALLHAILSFLPAPQVVRTCLLSQRWRHLWRSAPCIKIIEQDFGISMRSRMTHTDLDEKWARFEDFATNLLMFHDNTSSLDEFLVHAQVYNQRHVDRWIRRGIEYCPAVLHILVPGYDLTLKLPPMASSSFHRLKRLCLQNVDLDGQFTYLLSTFPVMEDLELTFCKFTGDCSQGITLSTLKKLVLDCCQNNTSRLMVIMAPSLSCLDLSDGCYLAGIALSKMDSLAEAMIEITENKTLSQNTQRGLLGSLFNVTSLELSGFESKVMLNPKSDTFPIFRNMRTLCFNSCFLDEYDGLNDKLEALGCFLQYTPCLEKLILQSCMFASAPDYEWETEKKNITLQRQSRETLQCCQLKLIEVLYEHDHDHQLIELLWWLGRSIPDAIIKLTKF